MAKTLYLEIITPEKQFFTGNVEGIVLPALDGQYGVQPGHEPIVTALEPGNVRYCVDGAWKEIVVTQGFAEIMPDYAIMLVSTAERPDEIDRARAERAKQRAAEHSGVLSLQGSTGACDGTFESIRKINFVLSLLISIYNTKSRSCPTGWLRDLSCLIVI